MKKHSTLVRFIASCLAFVICLSMTACGPFILTPDEPAPEQPEPAPPEPIEIKDITFENGSAVLEDNCTLYFSIDSVTIDKDGNAQLNYTFRNNHSADLRLFMEDVSINGWMLLDSYAKRVNTGNEATGTVTIVHNRSYNTLYNAGFCGITEVTDLQLTLEYGEVDNYEATYIRRGYSVFPEGVTPLTAERSERLSSLGEIVVLDNEQLKVVIFSYSYFEDQKHLSQSMGWPLKNTPYYPSCTMSAYIENKTDRMVDFEWNIEQVNYLCTNTYNSIVLQPNARTYMNFVTDKDILSRYTEFNPHGIHYPNGNTLIAHQMLLRLSLNEYSTLEPLHEDIYELRLCDCDPDVVHTPFIGKRAVEESETVLTDDDHCQFVHLYEEDDDYLYSFFIQNRTDKPLYVFAYDVVIVGVFNIQDPEPFVVPPYSMMYGLFPHLRNYATGEVNGAIDLRITDDPNHYDDDTVPAEGAYVFETGMTFSNYVN